MVGPTAAETDLPEVTVVMPCLNERNFIERSLRSIVEGGYPCDKLSLLIFDGMSSDGTRDVVSKLQREFNFIRLIDNPGASKPVALNRAIAMATGTYLIRADAHAEYSPNYLKTLISTHQTMGVDNVGPVRENMPRNNTLLARCFAKTLSHRFGVGDAQYNIGVRAAQRTDIVFLFCVRRDLFQKVGGFDERLRRGQDREFNLRLKRLGYVGVVTPAARVTYYVRSNLGDFLSWAVEAGFVPFAISEITGRAQISFRNLIPMTFLMALCCSSLIALLFPRVAWLFIAIFGSYMMVAVITGAAIATKERDLRFAVAMPVVFLLWHLTYGYGSLKALLQQARRYNPMCSKSSPPNYPGGAEPQ